MLDSNKLQNIIGSTVYDNAGEKIGKAAQVYLSNRDDEIEWLTVSTGLFGSRESFVPARQATFGDEEIRVPVAKDQVKNAPQIEPDRELAGEEEQQLYQYYGIDYADAAADGTTPREGAGTDQRRDAEHNVAGRGTDGRVGDDRVADDRVTGDRATDGRVADDGVTVSKEELEVGTRTTEAGRVRLRKYVTTREETVTVPVSHEEVRVVREPVTDSGRDRAVSDTEISEDEREVILHREEPVVATKTTPVERVRLETESVTEERQVTGEVREEHVDLDTAGDADVVDRDRRR